MANNDSDNVRALIFNDSKEAAAVAAALDASVNSNPRIVSYQHQRVSEPASSFSTKPLWKILMRMFVIILAVFLLGMTSLLWYHHPSWYRYQHHAQRPEPAALYEYKPKPRVFLRPETETSKKHEHRSLLLLRHAKSSWDDPTGTLDDFDRPLALEGQLAALQLADYVLHHNVPPPDVIYVSPSIRTLATLALVRSQGWAMHNVPMILDERLYAFEEDDENITNNSYLEYLRNLNLDNDTNYRRIMIVGHNPPIGALAQRLVQDDSAILGKFSPGSLCDIYWDHLEDWAQVEDGTGKLGVFVRPRKSDNT